MAMGKFGGRELNYYSDLDLIFLYEADGTTVHARRTRRDTTHQQPAFLQRAGPADHQGRQPTWAPTAGCTRSIRGCGPPARAARWPCRWPSSAAISPKGRGSSGSGRRCARPASCYASPAAAETAPAAVTEAALPRPGIAEDVETVWQMRQRLEEERRARQSEARAGRPGRHRVPGADAAAQARRTTTPRSAVPGTLEALEALGQAGYLSADDCDVLHRELSLSADHSIAPAADEHHGPRRSARRAARAGQAGRPAALRHAGKAAGRLPALHRREPPPVRAVVCRT